MPMRHTFFVKLFAITMTVFIPVMTLAQKENPQNTDATIFSILEYTATGPNSAGYSASTDANTIAELIGKVTFVVLSLLGIIFVSLTVYAGYLWLTSAGNSEQVKKAQDILKSSVLGIFVILGAFLITTLVYSGFS